MLGGKYKATHGVIACCSAGRKQVCFLKAVYKTLPLTLPESAGLGVALETLLCFPAWPRLNSQVSSLI